MTWVIDTERRRLMNPIFPFAALVAQDKLNRAHLLCAVNPSLSCVLIRGDNGTATSTAARGWRELLAPIHRVPGSPYNCAPGESLAYCPVCNADHSDTFSHASLAPAPFVSLP